MKNGDKVTISAIHNTRENIAELEIAGILDDFEPYITQALDTEDYKAAFVLMLSKDMYPKEMANLTSTEFVFANIYISTDKPFELEKEIEEGKIKDIESTKEIFVHGENLYAERLEDESILELIKLLLYGFEIMITVF